MSGTFHTCGTLFLLKKFQSYLKTLNKAGTLSSKGQRKNIFKLSKKGNTKQELESKPVTELPSVYMDASAITPS
ncbi:hypothetical protein HK099_002781 [Clydaea vesicula]|uniref:Uncharacterized protein n=1 Tax=Clydaea vesicula TaxID=447962 RepID=A0AAD5TXD4_9FUNG|nr:hypothetical protein HK099_002781 [Clydaea vesicula]KAJ3377741.1 hypothetical protein HDU92_008025 [Lobulomyces angularis]